MAEVGRGRSEVGVRRPGPPAVLSAEGLAEAEASAKGGRRVRLLAVGALLLSLVGCHVELLPPIRQRGAWLVIENQTPSAWKNVTVTLNAYYRGGSPTLAPGGRLEAPLANFATGLGQRFNTAREHISRVEVRATDAAGKPVVLDWDEKTGPPLVQEGRQ